LPGPEVISQQVPAAQSGSTLLDFCTGGPPTIEKLWREEPMSVRRGVGEFNYEPSESFIGIDVSKGHLDVTSLHDSQTWSLANNSEEIPALVTRLKQKVNTLSIERSGYRFDE
jgi:hypothetical protein